MTVLPRVEHPFTDYGQLVCLTCGFKLHPKLRKDLPLYTYEVDSAHDCQKKKLLLDVKDR